MTTRKSVNNSLRDGGEKSSEKGAAGRPARVSVVSLNDEGIVSSIFREIGHSTVAHQDLRRQIFRQVAKSAKLQHMILDVLSKQPEVQTSILQELAKNPQLKRKFVVVAHEQRNSQVTSQRKKPRNS